MHVDSRPPAMGRLTLWRGERLWGELILREPLTQTLSAVLLPDENAEGLCGIRQHISPIFPGSPVYQFPVEPNVESRDIDTGLQLRVEEDGRVLSTPVLSVLEVRPLPGTDPTREGLPSEALVNGSLWLVHGRVEN